MNKPQEPNIASQADDLTAQLKKKNSLTKDEIAKLHALHLEIERLTELKPSDDPGIYGMED
jgi:hypothetical protein